MEKTLNRPSDAASKCIVLNQWTLNRVGRLCAIAVMTLVPLASLQAKGKGKKAKPQPAEAIAAPQEAQAEPGHSPEARSGLTRWSTYGINLGVYGAFVNPSPVLDGGPDAFKIGKENGYSYGAKLSYHALNVYNFFTAVDTFDYKITGSQNGLTQKYQYSGYRALLGLEMTGHGIRGAPRVGSGFSMSALIGLGVHVPTKATVEIDGKILDRSAFVNTAAGFLRLGLNVYYVLNSGINMGLGYHYDWMAKIEKSTDTGEEIKRINSHNFTVFVDARILNFGSNTYAE